MCETYAKHNYVLLCECVKNECVKCCGIKIILFVIFVLYTASVLLYRLLFEKNLGKVTKLIQSPVEQISFNYHPIST